MIRVILHGYKGRMGKVLVEMISEANDMQVVAGIDHNADNNVDFPTFKSLQECNIACDVIIDFSNHQAIPSLLNFSSINKVPTIVATTALTEKELNLLYEHSKSIPIFYSANMSIGINAIANCLKLITPVLEDSFNIEIIEKHHNQKKDSPSGTALLLANAINGECKTKKEYIYGRHGNDDECSINHLGIHALRGGTIPGEHTIIYAGNDEIIEIKHTALSRNIFANGAINAARFIVQQNAGLYDMNNLLKSVINNQTY